MLAPRTRHLAGALALGALVTALVGCSSDGAPEASTRRCAVVQAPELSKITGLDLSLQPHQKGSSACTFTTEDDQTVVVLNVRGPVEPAETSLTLQDPRTEAGLGDEAWSSTTGTPLGTRLQARKEGALLTVDVRKPGATAAEERTIARAIAKAGIPELPKMPTKGAKGPRGTKACEPFTGSKAAAALGGKTTVDAVNPPGSCLITLEELHISIPVTTIVESGASRASLDALVKGAPDAKPVELAGNEGYWVPDPAAPGQGGNLTLLIDDRLVQISVIAQDLPDGDHYRLATAAGVLAAS